MAREATTTAAAPAPEPAVKMYLTWRADFSFEARELSAADTKSLGATEGRKLRWSVDNDWRVERSEVPLNDEQLADFLARDNRFKLVEG